MTDNRPTYINYSSPASEESVYFDAPMMHIFSKGGGNDEDGYVAPSPAHSRIRTTTPLGNGRGGVLAPHAISENPGAPYQPGDNTDSEREDENVLSRDYGTGSISRKPRQGSASTGDATSDSGYGSPSPRNKLRGLREGGADMQPIPVVWAGPDGETPQRNFKSPTASSADPRRSQSMRSFRSGTNRDEDGRDSVRTTPSRYTPSERRRRASLTGGTFANGAGTIGPAAAPSEEDTNLFRSRSVSAESALSKKQMLKIGKEELKEGKRLAKVIKQEAKVEKKALDSAIRELADLQKLQKYAVKEEAKTNASYGSALHKFHQEELAFLAAQAKFERAKADLQAYEDALEAAREHARQATEMLQEKSREVEWLRAQKAADDREREAKIRQLKGKA